MTAIECKDLWLSYGSASVIEGLSFSLENGKCLCIAGENGTGKSTLIKALLGLKDASRGEIVFFNGEKKHGIGYLPQRSDAQSDFPASVWEVVLSGKLTSGKRFPFYTKKDKEEAMAKLELLDILRLKDKSFAELSGGQQQRVLLARALCAATQLILLDEPVAGLDPTATSEFYKIIHRLKDEGITVIMVSHDIHCALAVADKLLILRNDGYSYTDAKPHEHDHEGGCKI
ncbi:MAG: metal ABC transporter ATP-binding protein [Clostridia bacterium]|nr:metal ABC transporter ATP-binding protein [Clostridia bacterium]